MVHRLIHPRRVALVGLALSLGAAIAMGPSLQRDAQGEAHIELAAAEASPPEGADAPDAPTTEPAAAEPLDARIDALIAAAPALAGARLGVHVVDLRSGETVYARGAELALNPASNAKLLTTAAALARLGPEHRYSTKVYVGAGGLADGVVEGELYLEGSGDPSLVTGEIYELAGQLEAAGVTKIHGPIIVDTSRFDHDGLPPGFDQKDEFASYRAPGGAMSVNYNTYEVFAQPGKAIGQPPKLAVQPEVASIVLDASKATTVAGNRNKLWVSTKEQKGKTVVMFHGEVGIDNGPSSYRYPVSDPSRYAGELLALALEQRGIKLRKARIERGEVPGDAKLLGTSRSETLSELCRAVNKYSNNFMAEQILRTLAPGEGATAEAALDELRAYSREIAMPQDGLVIGNGSGLYANNTISARAMTHLLAHVYGDFRYRADFLASLAIMGADGTTRRRLHESEARGYVRVKTGTLDDVSALSGYAGASGRDPFAFSILFNDLERQHRGQARALQDAIAELLAAEAARTRR